MLSLRKLNISVSSVQRHLAKSWVLNNTKLRLPKSARYQPDKHGVSGTKNDLGATVPILFVCLIVCVDFGFNKLLISYFYSLLHLLLILCKISCMDSNTPTTHMKIVFLVQVLESFTAWGSLMCPVNSFTDIFFIRTGYDEIAFGSRGFCCCCSTTSDHWDKLATRLNASGAEV